MSTKAVMTGPKGVYARPAIRVYGDMKQLTAGGSGKFKELQLNGSPKLIRI